ncbi:aspartate carbamoyltransferase [Coraliomargarita sinensis]|uniref:Aspartate carbamoyltransferase n=1 Tax=Coraliomargarita sinensis TaxID=2174842 RepID=A0A317ZF85_9BACT|nr:aspartate carbamoyltransferase catalytic subunit [Coraliomargarita sinensis]PXA03017.1 aspartate carbamoyltransferase [Coraliomargarita sinensis]
MSQSLAWNRKDLIDVEHLSRDEIETIFTAATAFKRAMEADDKKQPYLEGRTVVNLFLEPSTRTRLAFEVAASRLSADTITVTGGASSLTKGETLRDTARNMEALKADMIIMRHSASGAPNYLSKVVDIPVINGGDGSHAHPTQALLDSFTLLEKFGSLEGKRITILGDILFSRVARSNIWCLQKLGAEVTIAGPSTLVPKEFEALGVHVCHDLQEALEDADAVMLLRIQHERQTATHFPSIGEYTSTFGLNKQRAKWLKLGAIIMHPGPINRGVEIDSELADSEQSVVLQQVTNGIVVRMAVLHLCYCAHNGKSIELP